MKMEDICRLCLKVSFAPLFGLDDTEIVHKLKSCTMFSISTHPSLPNKICFTCKMNIDEFFNFYVQVVKNEKMLVMYLERGWENLNGFFDSILEKHAMKLKSCDALLTPKEEEEVKEVDIRENKNRFVDKTNEAETDNLLVPEIKTECFFETCDDKTGPYSSDDDVNLSAIKSIKSKNKIKHRKKPKKEKKRKKIHSPADCDQAEIKTKSVFEDSNPPKYLLEYESNWKCLTCSDCFLNRNMLLSHYKMEHGCQRNKSENIIEDSCNFEVDGEQYKCLKCKKMYNQKRLILRHINSHTEERPYVCKVCGRTYKTASDIVRHGRAHNQVQMLFCKYERCTYSTAYMGALREHEKRHCDDYKYKCEKCGKGFQVKTWYEQHQNIHTGDRPYVCHICGRTFQMQRYLKTHISTVHPQVSEVKRHMCTECGTLCDTRHSLNIHLKTHGIAATYMCDTCGKSLSSAQHLRLHSRVHLGIKPHTCGTCGKSFSKKCNLQLHKRVHSGEKPFVCSYCGKAFSQKSTLHIHVRYHTGSRPYKCENCTKSFVCQGLLSSHKKGCP